MVKPLVRPASTGAKRSATAFGNLKADVLEKLLPGYVSPHFCAIVAGSPFLE